MRYYRVHTKDGIRLVVEDHETSYDLTSAASELRSFRGLNRLSAELDKDIDSLATEQIEKSSTLDEAKILKQDIPIVPDEVWAAGVTYKISEEARESESTLPDIYRKVYESSRPEIFFKATKSRVVGPDEAVGIRGDSDWNVPEPELGVVLHQEEVVAYTIGNDVSSRSIESENPLYLPQAKVYDRCCSLGPCVVTENTIGDPSHLKVSLQIERKDAVVYSGETDTERMVRSIDELVAYLTRHNSVPEIAVLLTGTSLVPDDEFSLQADDRVRITIENIGTLTNSVMTV